MSACMTVLRRSRIFGDLTTYCRLNAIYVTLKREKADIPKPKFDRDKNDNKVGVCLMPFPRVLDMDPRVEEACESPQRDLKFHAGIMTTRPVPLPELLTYNARLLLAEKQLLNNSALEKDVQRLHNVFKCRTAPLEKKKVDKDLQNIFARSYEEMLQQGVDPAKLDEDQRQYIERKLLDSFNKTHHKWSRMQLDKKSGLTYMAARLAPNFKVLYQIFSEIRKRDRQFLPTSIYNFGSGLGTVVWAADAIWGRKVFEYYNVDESPDMLEMARKLLATDMSTLGSSIKGVNFRQFPLSEETNAGSFKMTVSAYTLMDQPNRMARLSMVDSLWKLTDDYLVLVEHGTTAGHKLIMEARDFILKVGDSARKDSKHVTKKEPDGHVFAPCTHDKVCPKLELFKSPCYFTTEYRPLNTANEYGQSLRNKTDMYSYVVMKKGARREDDHSYPRILDVVKKHGYSECEMCCRDGSMRKYAVSKSKPSKLVHMAARKSQGGDFLPVIWPSEEQMQEYEVDHDPSPPRIRKRHYNAFQDSSELQQTAEDEIVDDFIGDRIRDIENLGDNLSENLDEFVDERLGDNESLGENVDEFLDERIRDIADLEEASEHMGSNQGELREDDDWDQDIADDVEDRLKAQAGDTPESKETFDKVIENDVDKQSPRTH